MDQRRLETAIRNGFTGLGDGETFQETQLSLTEGTRDWAN